MMYRCGLEGSLSLAIRYLSHLRVILTNSEAESEQRRCSILILSSLLSINGHFYLRGYTKLVDPGEGREGRGRANAVRTEGNVAVEPGSDAELTSDALRRW
jgi:hypothetical protein